MNVFARHILSRARESVVVDSRAFKITASLLGVVVGIFLLLARKGSAALKVLTAVHRAAYFNTADKIVESLIRRALHGAAFSGPLRDACRAHIESSDSHAMSFEADPTRLLGPLAMVLRSPTDTHKGVISDFRTMSSPYSRVCSTYAGLWNATTSCWNPVGAALYR